MKSVIIKAVTVVIIISTKVPVKFFFSLMRFVAAAIDFLLALLDCISSFAGCAVGEPTGRLRQLLGPNWRILLTTADSVLGRRSRLSPAGKAVVSAASAIYIGSYL